MDYLVLIAIVWLHFIADFIFQTDRVATGKSKSNAILFEHVMWYGLPFFIFYGWKYAVANQILHFITDYITSRTTSHLWSKNERHWFFVVIGVDQAIHMTCLIATYAVFAS